MRTLRLRGETMAEAEGAREPIDRLKAKDRMRRVKDGW
jgi:hypothetical protein